MSISSKNQSLFFYSLWFIIGIIQAFTTQISGDEAYYWMYSQDLDWGYFDHPPINAFFVKIGSLFITGALGVRLMAVIAITLGIYALEKIIQPTRKVHFYLITASFGVLHFIGFLAIPDAPFFLFACLFIWAYSHFLKLKTIKWTLFLGLFAALMIMSKYHGIILIGLLIISNLKLLKLKGFWLSVFICLLLLIPHLLWQIENGFPSVQYHLFERSQEGFALSNTSDYILIQLLFLGPFIGFFCWFSAFKLKSANEFEKGLKWVFWGTFIFFFLMTFKGRVEPHWTFYTVIPGVYFAYRLVEKFEKITKWLKIQFVLSMLLIFTGRLFLSVDLLPKDHYISTNWHQTESRMQEIAEIADGRPVIFLNLYDDASYYTFFTGEESGCISNVMGRKSQFDLWESEEKYRGKDVMLIPNYVITYDGYLSGETENFQYVFINNFQSFSFVELTWLDQQEKLPADTPIDIKIKLEPFDRPEIDFNSNPDYPPTITYQFFDRNKIIVNDFTNIHLNNDMIGQEFTINIRTPEEKGDYYFYISISTGWIAPLFNSERFEITIE